MKEELLSQQGFALRSRRASRRGRGGVSDQGNQGMGVGMFHALFPAIGGNSLDSPFHFERDVLPSI